MIVFVIKELRKKKNITQYRLSQITDISRTYIRDLENNKMSNPTVNILLLIADALEVNVKDLFYTKLDINTLKREFYIKTQKYGINSQEALEIKHILNLLKKLEKEHEINEKSTHED